MRTTRGLLATLGASTSLVLAGALALFSVSTIVAFRGWPGLDGPGLGGNDTSRIAVSAAAPSGSGTGSFDRVVVPAPPKPHRRTAPAARKHTVPARPAVVVSQRLAPQAHVPATPRAVTAPAHSSPPPAATHKPPKVLRVPENAGDPVRNVGGGLSKAFGSVGGGLGDVVRPVSPGLGTALDAVGGGLSQVVQNVTDALAALLDRLAGK